MGFMEALARTRVLFSTPQDGRGDLERRVVDISGTPVPLDLTTTLWHRLERIAAAEGLNLDALLTAIAGGPGPIQDLVQAAAFFPGRYGDDQGPVMADDIPADRTPYFNQALYDGLTAVAKEIAARPLRDCRTDDEILGYDENGLPQ